MTIEGAVDFIFSHNEIVAIWEKRKDDDGFGYSELVWFGMAHEIPNKYLSKTNWKIFGVIANSLCESDRLNIRIG